MGKFNPRARTTGTSPVTSEVTPSGATHEGASGYARDPKSELFLLAVSSMAGEDTFYEDGSGRDARFRSLIRRVTAEDPGWAAGFLPWLRTDAHMRSAPLIGAVEAAKVIHGARPLISAVCQRADEPGTLLAIWLARYGKPVPIAVKRGLADAVIRLYNERAFLKYDSQNAGVRFADVIELCNPRYHHPEIRGTWREQLYGYAIAARHGRNVVPPPELAMITKRRQVIAVGGVSDPEDLRAAGMTWEALAGIKQGPMDAPAWEAIIPSMGYMALLRNLRNFDAAGISGSHAAEVADVLANPANVARSRQLPLRFLSAYRSAPSLRWAWPLEVALDHSIANIPRLPGRTLVLVDRSASMGGQLSSRSGLTCGDAAAVFGTALAIRCESSNLIQFGTGSDDIGSTIRAGESLLKIISRFTYLGGTYTLAAVRRWYSGHDRVVILTDEQAADSGSTQAIPAHIPVYTWNLAGYKHGHGPSGTPRRHTFGGLTDTGFRMIPLIEAGQRADWPWLSHA